MDVKTKGTVGIIHDNEGRKEGIRQFLDDKTLKPGVGIYDLSKQKQSVR